MEKILKRKTAYQGKIASIEEVEIDFGNDKKAANVMDVCQKGCYVKAILELNSVFLKKNQFSSSATALQLRVFPADRMTGYPFLPDEDDDEVIVLADLAFPIFRLALTCTPA